MALSRREFVIAGAAGAELFATSAIANGRAQIQATRQRVRVTGLAVDGLAQPIGVESIHPRLSWRLESDDRNVSQSAFRVVVSSSEEAARRMQGDLWDSGKVRTNSSLGIEYLGRTLTSRSKCWWCVQVWDESDSPSEPSSTSFWEMGLLAPMDWQAQWLSVENAAGKADRDAGINWIWGPTKLGRSVRKFRGAFNLPAAAQGGTLYAIANDIRIWSQISQVWIDDVMVGGAGAWTDAEGQAELAIIERALGSMDAGPHSIAVEVHTADIPSELPEAHLEYALAVLCRFNLAGDGCFVVTSGTSWKTSSTEDPHWYAPQYDDASWEAVRAVDLNGYQPIPLQPAMHLRHEFKITQGVVRARLYVTALGAYQARINGNRVGDAELTPEISQYSKRVLYRVYDVEKLLATGENALGLTVGDGWYGSFDGHFSWAPPPRRVLAQLEITLADGSAQLIATGPGWRIAESPIRRSELKAGEFYDARLEQRGWDRAGFNAATWKEAELIEAPAVQITAQIAPPIRATQVIKPHSVTQPRPGVYIFDFGQHFTGWARLHCHGAAGARVELTFAELLAASGEIDVPYMNMGRAKVDVYILRGDPEGEIFEPGFTYRSFRYVQVTGGPEPLTAASLEGIVVHSDLKHTGTLRVDNPLIEALWRNLVRTERSSLIGTVVDTPSREQRTWVAAAGLLWDSAAYHWDVAAFTQRYMDNVVDEQSADGAFPAMAPVPRHNSMLYHVPGPSPGCGDMGIILPWTAWQRYGDRAIIERYWEAMKRHMQYIEERNPDHVWRHGRGMDWNEWLSLDQMILDSGLQPTPPELIGTAYWAHIADLMAAMAAAIGRPQESQRLQLLAKGIRQAFNREFVRADGVVANETQTGYVIALAFDLVNEDSKQAAARRLAENVRNRGVSLTTGRVGTRYILDVLTDAGYPELAYGLLVRTEFPSWGYSILQGATTIWETWNGRQNYKDSSGQTHRLTMARNHPELGTVGGFLFRRIAGIEPASPGFTSIIIRPVSDGTVKRGGGDFDSVMGRISTDWKWGQGGEFFLDVVIPANCSAHIHLPAAERSTLHEGRRSVAGRSDIKIVRRSTNELVLKVGSGTYTFAVLNS